MYNWLRLKFYVIFQLENSWSRRIAQSLTLNLLRHIPIIIQSKRSPCLFLPKVHSEECCCCCCCCCLTMLIDETFQLLPYICITIRISSLWGSWFLLSALHKWKTFPPVSASVIKPKLLAYQDWSLPYPASQGLTALTIIAITEIKGEIWYQFKLFSSM